MSAGSDGANVGVSVAGLLWNVAETIVGWALYDSNRNRTDRQNDATLYLDRILLEDKAKAVIFAHEVFRNIQLMRDIDIGSFSGFAQIVWREAGYSGPMGLISNNRKSSKTGKNFSWIFPVLESIEPQIASMSEPMRSYDDLQFPKPKRASKISVRDDGFYIAQGRYILPPLDAGSYGVIASIFSGGVNKRISCGEWLRANASGDRMISESRKAFSLLYSAYRFQIESWAGTYSYSLGKRDYFLKYIDPTKLIGSDIVLVKPTYQQWRGLLAESGRSTSEQVLDWIHSQVYYLLDGGAHFDNNGRGGRPRTVWTVCNMGDVLKYSPSPAAFGR